MQSRGSYLTISNAIFALCTIQAQKHNYKTFEFNIVNFGN